MNNTLRQVANSKATLREVPFRSWNRFPRNLGDAVERTADSVKANAAAFRQRRPWLRGADLNRRPLGYAI
jgi:hypothetical protein